MKQESETQKIDIEEIKKDFRKWFKKWDKNSDKFGYGTEQEAKFIEENYSSMLILFEKIANIPFRIKPKNPKKPTHFGSRATNYNGFFMFKIIEHNIYSIYADIPKHPIALNEKIQNCIIDVLSIESNNVEYYYPCVNFYMWFLQSNCDVTITTPEEIEKFSSIFAPIFFPKSNQNQL